MFFEIERFEGECIICGRGGCIAGGEDGRGVFMRRNRQGRRKVVKTAIDGECGGSRQIVKEAACAAGTAFGGGFESADIGIPGFRFVGSHFDGDILRMGEQAKGFEAFFKFFGGVHVIVCEEEGRIPAGIAKRENAVGGARAAAGVKKNLVHADGGDGMHGGGREAGRFSMACRVASRTIFPARMASSMAGRAEKSSVRTACR